jgi:chemotaxis signal transduction protein
MLEANIISYPSKTEFSEPLRVVTFTIANHILALPIERILKIVNCPPQFCNRSSNMELIHLGRRTITILDIHRYLTPSTVLSPAQQHFLIITPLQTEVYAILVDAPPNLVELPTSAIRPVPQSYGQDSLDKIASHVAVLPEAETNSTIFLLDVEQTLRNLGNVARRL